MRALNFLILTDHRGHSDQNSVYALTRQLAADSRTGTVMVASRGVEANQSFFAGDPEAKLSCILADASFDFDPSKEQWRQGAHGCYAHEADVIWLRLPPPADVRFFAALSNFAPASAPAIVNNPEGIMETGSKAFLLNFPDFTAPVRRVQSEADLLAFAADHDLVLKPLSEYGGRGIVKVSKGVAVLDGKNVPLADFMEQAREDIINGQYLAMKYLKNVDQGDKRILVVNGKILGASLRLPASGGWLCNVAMGGTSVPASVSPEEEVMVAAISPVLLKKGICFFGLDTLVDDSGKRVLSEINSNSIGGFPQAQAQSGRPVLQQTINELYDFLRDRF